MAQSFTTDELKALFAFPFQLPDWKNKFLIGSLLTLAGYAVPVVPFVFIYGYAAQIMRRIIIEQGEPFLPEWDDWGKLFTDGLKITGASLIYMLPLVVVALAGYGVFLLTVFVPLFVTGESSGSEPVSPLAVLPVVGAVGWIAFMGIAMLFGLIISLFLPAAIGHVIATDQFAAAFRLGEVWAIFRANLTGFLVSYALLIGFWLVLGVVFQILYLTIIFCCLYPFVVAPLVMYTTIIWSVLFARAYRTGVETLAL
jgi:hypothetical protein